MRGAGSGLLALLLVLGVAAPVAPNMGGGRNRHTDCYVEFRGITPIGRYLGKPRVDCADGDPSCDADGVVNGKCTFTFAVCEFNVDRSLPRCTPQPVTKLLRFPPEPPAVRKSSVIHLPPRGATSTTCARDSSVTVPLGVRHGKPWPAQAKIELIAVAKQAPYYDKNVFYLRCLPHVEECILALCPNNPAGGPREVDFVEAATGGDLDNGTTGLSHNFPIPQNSTLKYCLSNCDGASTPSCQASGSTGGVACKDSLNGATFGPPLPLFSSNVPLCVVNRFADNTIQGVVNVQTGIFDATATPVHLNSDVYLTNQPPLDVCPICTGSGIGAHGTCDSGPNRGTACTVEGIVTVNNPPALVTKKYTLSSSCPPDPIQLKATLNIKLPLINDPGKPSTLAAHGAGSYACPGQTQHDACGGTPCDVDCSATKPLRGGVNQLCCHSDDTTPCFPTSPASGSQPVVRTGSATAPTPTWVPNSTPSATSTSVLAATFCEAATGSAFIDTTIGLPGPGALLLNGTATFLGNQ